MLDIRDKVFNSALYIGAGLYKDTWYPEGFWSPILKANSKVAIECNYLKAKTWKNSDWIIMWDDYPCTLPFIPDSFDIVVCLEYLEHLTKPEGYDLIEECLRCSNHVVIFLTRLGFFDTALYDFPEFDVHKSGWLPNDFENYGFETEILYDVVDLNRDVKFDALWAWKEVR